MKQQHATESNRQPRYGLAACALFLIALTVLIVISTLFDSSLGQLSLTAQRWIGYLTLVLPALVGAILGCWDCNSPERRWRLLGLCSIRSSRSTSRWSCHSPGEAARSNLLSLAQPEAKLWKEHPCTL